MEKYIKISDAWDHDHCEFCWAKFSLEGHSGDLDEGYATKDNYQWIVALFAICHQLSLVLVNPFIGLRNRRMK